MQKIYSNIVCIGDSTTSQEWCHPNWVDWLNFIFKQGDSKYNYNVINSGIDGGTVDIYLENFDSLIKSYNPEIAILSLGFNHLEGLVDFEKKTEELIKRIKEINCEVILWSTYETSNPKYSQKLEIASKIYSNLSLKLKCKFVDIYKEFKKYDLSKIFTYIHKWNNEDWDLKPGDIDFIHCNGIGNQIIAEKILKDIFNLDFTLCNEFKGMGNMDRVDLSKYLVEV